MYCEHSLTLNRERRIFHLLWKKSEYILRHSTADFFRFWYCNVCVSTSSAYRRIVTGYHCYWAGELSVEARSRDSWYFNRFNAKRRFPRQTLGFPPSRAPIFLAPLLAACHRAHSACRSDFPLWNGPGFCSRKRAREEIGTVNRDPPRFKTAYVCRPNARVFFSRRPLLTRRTTPALYILCRPCTLRICLPAVHSRSLMHPPPPRRGGSSLDSRPQFDSHRRENRRSIMPTKSASWCSLLDFACARHKLRAQESSRYLGIGIIVFFIRLLAVKKHITHLFPRFYIIAWALHRVTKNADPVGTWN